MYTIHINNGKKGVQVSSIEEARAAYAAWAAKNAPRGSTYRGTPVIQNNTVVGYISMNGRYWTREEGHSTTDSSKINFDLMIQRAWGKHLVA